MMGFAVLEDLTGQIECLLFPQVYDRHAPLLAVDKPVLVRGKLSVREEEETKLLVDGIEPMEAPPRGGTAREPSRPDDMAAAKEAPVRLYLRLKRDQLPGCEEVLRKMKGEVPVFLNLPDESVTFLAPREWWCEDAAGAREHLLNCLASDDIKVVKRK